MSSPSTYTVWRSALIPAPAAVSYAIIADYHVGHPSIVPPRWFGPITVVEGGVGAGTRIRFDMKAMGKSHPAEGVVTEPVPGHRLVETYTSGVVTSFTVERVGSAASRVTIETHMPRRGGLAGTLERVMVRRLLARIYEAELALLGDRAGDLMAEEAAAAAEGAVLPAEAPAREAGVAAPAVKVFDIAQRTSGASAGR